MGAMDSLNARLKVGEVVIMDGGTGTEIQRRGVPVSQENWSGLPMTHNPDLIREIHEDYIKAGAEIIITNTFSTGRWMLKKVGLEDRTVEINRLGVKLALEARANAALDSPVIVAGSMSTYSPWSDPTVIPSYEAALTDYREQAKALAEAGVDLIVVEMLVRTLDTRTSVKAAVETGLPVWVGYSVVREGEKLYLGLHRKHGGEGIREAVDAVASMGVSAMFIMHTSPEDTGPGLLELKECTSLPIGAYAHSMGFKTEEQNPDEIVFGPYTPEGYLEYARGWVEMGAVVIGGCCRTTPEHIRALKERLPERVPTRG